jgi:hypothetical protein
MTPQSRPHLTDILAAPDHTARVIARARKALAMANGEPWEPIPWAFRDRTCARCGTALARLVREPDGSLRCVMLAPCEHRAEMREAALRGEPVQIPQMKEVA